MGAHSIEHYTKIYAYLVGLFLISFAGPLLADVIFDHGSWIRFIVVMTTAFAVAVVKAWLVAKHFMHFTVEKRFIHYMMVTGLVLMVMFVAGTSVDIMNHHGANWENVAAKQEIARALAAGPSDHGAGHGDAAHGDGHGDGHGDEHAEPAHGGAGGH